MIRLNLTATPQWLDLGADLRLLVGPLTTALMVSARADPAIETLAEGASQEALALAMASALGIDTLIAAELLPEIEAVMVRKLNEKMEGDRDG